MNASALIDHGLVIQGSNITLSLVAVVAVFGDKFLRPTLERAEALCATLRGEFSKELVTALREFAPGRPGVANVLLGEDGNPIPANIQNATSFESEAFQEVVRKFLDSSSTQCERYQRARELRLKINRHWSALRTITGSWPIAGLLGFAALAAIQQQIIPTPPDSWLCTIILAPFAPFVLFVLRLPRLAVAANDIDSLKEA